MDVLLYGPAATIGATDTAQWTAQMEQATTALTQEGSKVDKSDLSWLTEHDNATEWSPRPWLNQAAAEEPTQTPQTPITETAVASQNNTQDVKIPWYVYALGAGVLLLGGILLFGKKK